MTMYESEFDQFLRQFKEKNPHVLELQRKNRATWWDRPQDLETWRERSEATVPQPAYVYFPLPTARDEESPPAGNPTRNP